VPRKRPGAGHKARSESKPCPLMATTGRSSSPTYVPEWPRWAPRTLRVGSPLLATSSASPACRYSPAWSGFEESPHQDAGPMLLRTLCSLSRLY
jgi:hypothetical protein